MEILECHEATDIGFQVTRALDAPHTLACTAKAASRAEARHLEREGGGGQAGCVKCICTIRA